MTETKVFKKYQSYFENEKGKMVEGLIITAKDKKEAGKLADDLYGEDAEVKFIKEKSK